MLVEHQGVRESESNFSLHFNLIPDVGANYTMEAMDNGIPHAIPLVIHAGTLRVFDEKTSRLFTATKEQWETLLMSDAIRFDAATAETIATHMVQNNIAILRSSNYEPSTLLQTTAHKEKWASFQMRCRRWAAQVGLFLLLCQIIYHTCMRMLVCSDLDNALQKKSYQNRWDLCGCFSQLRQEIKHIKDSRRDG